MVRGAKERERQAQLEAQVQVAGISVGAPPTEARNEVEQLLLYPKVLLSITSDPRLSVCIMIVRAFGIQIHYTYTACTCKYNMRFTSLPNDS